MPLPPAIEFLGAQSGISGNKLCHFGILYTEVVIPALTTVRWTQSPRGSTYGSYLFRLQVDPSVVPGAFRVRVQQAGARPYEGNLHGGTSYQHVDYFLRLTGATPTLVELANLTNLNQRWISYDQSLIVETEEDWKELENRLAYFNRQEERRTVERARLGAQGGM